MDNKRKRFHTYDDGGDDEGIVYDEHGHEVANFGPRSEEGVDNAFLFAEDMERGRRNSSYSSRPSTTTIGYGLIRDIPELHRRIAALDISLSDALNKIAAAQKRFKEVYEQQYQREDVNTAAWAREMCTLCKTREKEAGELDLQKKLIESPLKDARDTLRNAQEQARRKEELLAKQRLAWAVIGIIMLGLVLFIYKLVQS